MFLATILLKAMFTSFVITIGFFLLSDAHDRNVMWMRRAFQYSGYLTVLLTLAMVIALVWSIP